MLLDSQATCDAQHSESLTSPTVFKLGIDPESYFVLELALHRHFKLELLILLFRPTSLFPRFVVRLRQNFCQFVLPRCRNFLVSRYNTFSPFSSLFTTGVCLTNVNPRGKCSFCGQHSDHLYLTRLRRFSNQVNLLYNTFVEVASS